MYNGKPVMFYGADVVIFENAKKLRKNMTGAEIKLWQRISKNQVGVRFKSQHPVSNYVTDFYCHKAKLVIEVDGGVHLSKEAIRQDAIRTECLELLGLKVIRFTNERILQDIHPVLKEIRQVLKERLIIKSGESD